MTGAFAAFIFGLQRDQGRRAQDLGKVSRVRGEMDSLIRDLRPSLMDIHSSCLRRAEERVLSNGSERLHGLVESEVRHELIGSVGSRLSILNATDPSVSWYLIGVLVDSRPIMADMEGSVPETGPTGSNITDSVEGGASSFKPKPESLGVNTTMRVDLLARSKGGGLTVRDSLTVGSGRFSPADLLRSRGDRFADALGTGELSRMVGYVLSTLAQSKSLLGHGRDDDVPTGEVPGPLLTEEEVAACVDLSIALFARGHLGCTDGELLNRSGSLFSKAPGSGEEVPDLSTLVTGSEVPMDPSLVAIISEGLLSKTNPPSLERMLRPFLMAALEPLVLSALNYTGREDDLLIAAGGLSKMMDLAVKGLNSATLTLFGREIIDSSEVLLDDLITGILAEGGLKVPPGGFILARSFQDGRSWEGAPINSYPVLDLPDLTREVQVYLSTPGDEDLIYLSANGTKHSKADYFDPSDTFLGHRCDRYCVTVNFTVNGLEPDFEPFDPLHDNASRLGLMEVLGTASEEADGVTEGELLSLGRRALDSAIDSLLTCLSEKGDGLWREVWTGWSMDDLPQLDAGTAPFSLASILCGTALDSLVGKLSEGFIGSATLLGISEERSSYRSTIGEGLADWLLEEYDSLVDREAKLRAARTDSLADLLSHGAINSRSCRLDAKDIVFWHADQIIMGPLKDISPVLDDDQGLLALAMTVGDDGPGYGPLLEALTIALSSSFDLVKARELGTGGDGREPGVVRAALCGGGTRSAPSVMRSLNITMDRISSIIAELLNRTLSTIDGHFLRGLSAFGSRVLSVPGAGISGAIPRMGDAPRKGTWLEASIKRDDVWTVDLYPSEGVRSTCPDDDAPAYRTSYSVLFTGTYEISLKEAGQAGDARALKLEVPVDLDIGLEVSSVWEMEGATYNSTGTLVGRIIDLAGEARSKALEVMLNGSFDLLGDSLGSLNEVPPIIKDMLSGKDLDIAEMARVLSNVTLDLSRTVREAVKDAIRDLIALGVEGTVTLVLDALGIDRIELEMAIAGANIGLVSYRKALMGGNGTLLSVAFSVPSLGLVGAFRITRGSADVIFFGNLTYRNGPLQLRVLLDPFMTSIPHMVSIEGVLEEARDVRFSFACPALKEYRSLEISLKGSLGTEIFVPIPFLGIQAVIDAGLRVRYSRPDELAPRLNEARFQGGNLTSVEIYDPRSLPVHGCTVELQAADGAKICAWEVRGGPYCFKEVALTRENLLEWCGTLPSKGGSRVVLRSPSGEVMDDIQADDLRSGSLSRDRDGFGTLRWTDGTPGATNGGSLQISLSSLIFSIALDSLKEAYEEARSLYPLSFEMVVHLVERAIDLFTERLISMVRELVIDVRLFVHIEVEDASGSGGVGIELSFIALGDAVAGLLEWLYLNIKAFMADIMSGPGSGDMVSFPIDILEDCFVELLVMTQVETPVPLSKMAPPGVVLPDSLTIGIVGGYNMALPLRLLGSDIGDWSVYGGVYVMECPSSLVSLFYDVADIDSMSDLWLLRTSIWEERI